MTEHLRIEVISRDDLTEDVMDRIRSLCTRAYDEDFAGIMATFGESVHILAWLESTLVSHALWVTRWLQVGDSSPLRTAYIEAVATEPVHQGRGFASAILKEITPRISDFQLGGLSPSSPDYYRRFGWELWHGPLFIREDSNLIPSPEDEQVMILRLPATPELDLNAPLSAEWREGELW